jgi:glyoxylase-like metal-dependent hydrolase (beta-lactamase superfamily II)
MWEDEWGFWNAESTLETEPPHRVQVACEKLRPIRGQLELVDREAEIVSGVYALDARGHTPGHMAVSVRSAGEELLYTSDTVLHPIHLAHPEWHTDVYDHDLEQAAATKRRIFGRAATDGSLVLAFHFHPFPSLGHIVKREDGWQWQPIDL